MPVEAPKPEVRKGPESLGIGSLIRSVRFESSTDPNTGIPSFICRDYGKYIKLDRRESAPISTNRYNVVIVDDSSPGVSMRGAFRVRYATAADLAKHLPPLELDDIFELELEDLPEPPIEIKPKVEKKPGKIIAIERDAELPVVYVLDSKVPYNERGGRLIPSARRFRHFTLDKNTLETMEKIATAVSLREPCLLEGETSTSKTSSIEYLAMMTGNEVARLNLNGQTDTSELIGKFVPNDGQLQIQFQDLLSHKERLDQTSVSILETANKDGRGLTLLESQKIAQAENIKVSDWRWQDGIDIQAKKNGQWLILDEINLAEPQILERLNPQLEANPSIVLSESGGVVVRQLNEAEMALYSEGKLPGVEPLHPNFRIFATMNPAEYAGRQPMSPAYKDRWTGYRFVQPPTKDGYEAMINLMIFGEQPKVTVRGVTYESPKADSLLPKLEKMVGLKMLAVKLAKFEEAIERLARTREIGRSKKEPYIFTRRGLLEFLSYLENVSFVDRRTGSETNIKTNPKQVIVRAIQYYYKDKISDPADLAKVEDQLEAVQLQETHSYDWLK